jgi:mono/diheme cytochrome c family protein
MNRWRALLVAIPMLAACDEMSHQKRYDSEEASALFQDGKSLQAPPDGTIARDDPAWAAALAERPVMTGELLQRGQERYGIYCMPCHDAAGYGHGTVPNRGFPQPPSFHDSRLRDETSDTIVDVITKGHGVMYGYADRVTPSDRWAITAYIRALQLSQQAPIAILDDAERAQLGMAKP